MDMKDILTSADRVARATAPRTATQVTCLAASVTVAVGCIAASAPLALTYTVCVAPSVCLAVNAYSNDPEACRELGIKIGRSLRSLFVKKQDNDIPIFEDTADWAK